MPARIRVGTSGYHYGHWSNGVFYPAGLPASKWLGYYATCFNSVEINNSFYRLPSPAAFAQWRSQVAATFEFAVKFSRFGTHMKKLTDPADTIGRFLAAAEKLGRTLGPILVQLPPRWKANPGRLDAFLAKAPRRHRWAVEFRDRSWLTEEIFGILHRHGAALCVHDLIDRHPRVVTAGWAYLRYHGDRNHEGNYTGSQLRRDSERIRGLLRRGIDVYAYFNNDHRGYAVRNALTLRSMVENRGSEPGRHAPRRKAGATTRR